MGKNVIISEETVRDLLEAHASLSAWYYELWAALRGGTAPRPPDDAARAAFVERLASDFPEIASVARSIRVPRMFVPPPPTYDTPPPGVDTTGGAAPAAATQSTESTAGAAPATAPSDAPAAVAATSPVPAAPAAAEPGVAPPPMVVHSQVKYET